MNRGSISFSCIRGTQATMEYYVCMVPLTMLSKLFVFSDEELPASVRSQRILNKNRIPEMKNYILQNRDSYVFSALTASVDGDVQFTPIDNMPQHRNIGQIEIGLDTKILINDGQHRKAAIEGALKDSPDLKYEDIAVVIYPDSGLKRSQQMFSDLNRYAVRPTKSLNILYDQRDPFANMICAMVDKLPMFGEWVDRERASISNRSRALFTLSGIYGSSEKLFRGVSSEKQTAAVLHDFWLTAYEAMPDWQRVVHKEIKAAHLRAEALSGHVISQKALALVGNRLLLEDKPFSKMLCLKSIDWNKDNPIWQGHSVVNDVISGVDNSVQYIADYLNKLIDESEDGVA